MEDIVNFSEIGFIHGLRYEYCTLFIKAPFFGVPKKLCPYIIGSRLEEYQTKAGVPKRGFVCIKTYIQRANAPKVKE